MSQMKLQVFFRLLDHFSYQRRQFISSWRATLFFQQNDPFIEESKIEKQLRSFEEERLLIPVKVGRTSIWQANTPYIRHTNNVYELANEAYPIGSLSFSSALEILKLSDQRSLNIHITIPKISISTIPELENEVLRNNILPPETDLNQWQLNKAPANISTLKKWNEYELNPHSIKEEWIFGTEIREVEGVKIRVTDLERTLIDSLRFPKYCGGLNEVFRTWVRALDELNLQKLITYTGLFDSSILYQRIGFVLEKLELRHNAINEWKEKHTQRGGSRVLDPNSEFSSNYDEEWQLSINHPISILINKDADYS
ncbi:MAG: hypothetical protein WDZ80_01860 [Candidatus Paceibacterota bacterium]